MRFYCHYLTNITHNFHPSCFLQIFGLKLILVPPNQIIVIANIYIFLNPNCPNPPNSRNYKQIKIVNIYNFLNSNCPHTPNSKNIEKL